MIFVRLYAMYRRFGHARIHSAKRAWQASSNNLYPKE
jgi:hypothetical protein